MNVTDIISNLKRDICSGFEVEERTLNRYMIHTGYTYPDGDELHIILSNDEEGWFFSDEGHTMMWLSYEDFNLTESRRTMLDRTLNGNGVSLNDGELLIRISNYPADTISIALKSLIQTEIQIADLLYLDKETVRDSFIDDLKSTFSNSKISDLCEYDYKIIGEDKMEYNADIYVKDTVPILIFGIHTPIQCARATIAMLTLNKNKVK